MCVCLALFLFVSLTVCVLITYIYKYMAEVFHDNVHMIRQKLTNASYSCEVDSLAAKIRLVDLQFVMLKFKPYL